MKLSEEDQSKTKKYSFPEILQLMYAIPGMLFILYFNYRYAVDHGFIKWLLLGEIVATLKGIVWPYYLIKML